VHHSDYESHFESILGSLPSPSVSLGDQDAYSATTGLAYKITFGSGSVKSNVWMDTNYDWDDSVFEASAMVSLNSAVGAVAAAINHLMIEAGEPIPEFGSSVALLCTIVAMMTVVIGLR
jgi:hypothetical protein